MSDLPEGWTESTLADVIAGGLFSDGDWVESKDQDPDGDVRLIQLADVGDGDFRNRSRRFLTRAKAAELRCTFLMKGDILVARMPEPLGRACIFPGVEQPAVTAVDVCIVRLGSSVHRTWLLNTINSPRFRAAMEEFERGTTRKRISRTNLGRLPLPLPPLAEQRRIVEKVEALLAGVNSAGERLAKMPSILKRFRQSVLATACSGRLTETWRADGGCIDEVENEPGSWPTPSSWRWRKLKDLLDPARRAAYGVLQPGPDVSGGIPFVRVGDLKNGTVRVEQIKRIDSAIAEQYPRTRLQGNEILVSLVGTIGRSAVAPPSLAGANVARAVGVVPLGAGALPRWIHLALEHPAKNAELDELAREVARKTLNLGLLKAVLVPVPPLDEQHELVSRVGALFALADAIEARVAAATSRAGRLTQAILAKAFRGELVPPEAELARREGRHYEPASVLLDRIRSQRGQADQKRRKNRKGPKPKRTA